MGAAWRFLKTLGRSLVTMLVLGLSLLPLSALLLAFPALASQESVLEDTVGRRRGLLKFSKRIFAVLLGVSLLVVQLAIAVEATAQLPLPERGAYASIARGFLPAPMIMLGQTKREQEQQLKEMKPSPAMEAFFRTPLHEKLPKPMVQHWPVVMLFMYVLDVAVLLFIGRVPFAYNLRNLRVRWLTNGMTALAFLFVIGLLVFLLAFVNGMNDLIENTGVPGNVIVLSDGATDELFSNMELGAIDTLVSLEVDLDPNDRPIPPVRLARDYVEGRDVPLGVAETYYVVNQPIPNTNPPRRRFVQLRTVNSPDLARLVHGIELLPGGQWFEPAPRSPIGCVLGEGIAKKLGEDFGKPQLEPGDHFTLGDMTWRVYGVMKSEGTTVASEIWALRSSLIYIPLGKERITTIVLRTEQGTLEAARAFAHHINERYTQQKLKAYAEPDYFAELTKTNNDFLAAIVVVAAVMAIGGVFGMMTTMFASIAQRIRDVGVLRLLGFKRWQILVSFMLESLLIAVAGGAAGCLLCWLFVDGAAASSTISGGGGGGGKSFAITIRVNAEVVALGMLFAMMMGRLGGLVPALSAMRMSILDALK